MKADDLRKFFGDDPVNEVEVNPLRVAETYFFNSKNKSIFGYAARAIMEVIRLKLPFYSTFNSHYTMASRFIEVSCPYCTRKMRVVNGGGSGNSCNVQYRCDCGSSCSISTPEDGISFNPAKV